VGLFLGGVAAFAREALDDSVHTSAQLKLTAAMPPLLGVTPKLPQLALGGFAVELPWRSERPLNTPLEIVQWLPFREASDLIYKNIQLRQNHSRLSNATNDVSTSGESIVVTSALAGEGKSTIALALAFSAARLNQKVLLVDGNLRQPSLHEQLNLVNLRGLSNYLTTEVNRQPTIQQISLSGCSFDVLSAGSQNSDPVRLLASSRLATMIKQLEQQYDLVIIDGPSSLGRVDTIQLVSCCSGVVMVGRMDQVTMSQFSEAHYLLSKFNVIGIVANGGNVTKAKDNSSLAHRQSDELTTMFSNN
jgi:capsular exopolysaccharide synthesis family protein